MLIFWIICFESSLSYRFYTQFNVKQPTNICYLKFILDSKFNTAISWKIVITISEYS